jgi:hypothetical protein
MHRNAWLGVSRRSSHNADFPFHSLVKGRRVEAHCLAVEWVSNVQASEQRMDPARQVDLNFRVSFRICESFTRFSEAVWLGQTV